MRTEARRRRKHEQLSAKRESVLHELKFILKSSIVTDCLDNDRGRLLPALHELNGISMKRFEEYVPDCWRCGINDFRAGRELHGTLTMHAIADIWALHAGESGEGDLIGIAAKSLCRLSVLKNTVEYLLGDFRDVPSPEGWQIKIPDLSLVGEPLKAFSWLETTWGVLLSYAALPDAFVIRELGKRSFCSSLAKRALNALKCRCIAEAATEKGFVSPELSSHPLLLEYMAALYVVEDPYPLRSWPREWADAAQERLEYHGLACRIEDDKHLLSESGQKLVARLRLAPKPF
jgi:hypothetical protein